MDHLIIDDHQVARTVLEEFIQAINKAKEVLEKQEEKIKSDSEECIFIRDTNIVRRLKVDDILYTEAMGDYVKLHTRGKLYAIHTKLKTVEDRLPADKFLRIHRSYIVALNKIDTLQDGALSIGGKFLPVADTYRKLLSQRMNIL